MKRAVLGLLLVAIASAAAAGLHRMIISPAFVRVHVGESVTATAMGQFGGFGLAYGWKIPFESQNASIATAEGLMENPAWTANIVVTGRAPGITTIVSPVIGYGKPAELATIEVTCPAEPPIAPAAAVLRTEQRRPVTLQVAGPPLPGQIFTWYRGRTGDTSHSLAGAGPEVEFTPNDFGTFYVWVLSKSTCSTSMAEFRIDAPPVRRRPVSRF